MKNADDMLKEIVRVVDTSGDGKIQYEGVCGLLPCSIVLLLLASTSHDHQADNTSHLEFRTFVGAAERQLLLLFRSIDKNGDGRLDKDELLGAFQRAGLSVPRRRVEGFFTEIDMNHDGFITFDEWRYDCSLLPPHLPFRASNPPQVNSVSQQSTDCIFFFFLSFHTEFKLSRVSCGC